MKWDHVALANLNEILANIYPTDNEARRIATAVGLRPAFLTFEGKAITSWFSVLQAANRNANTVDAIVAKANEEFPGDEQLILARDHTPPPALKGPDLAGWRQGSAAETREKIMGARSTLVPIAYLQIGLDRSRSVVRVKRGDGGSGSGFVTDGNVLITNNHVLPSKDHAAKAIVQFNYQLLPGGADAPYEEAKLLPQTFRTSEADDWSAVRIEGDPQAKWGTIPLRKAAVKVGDNVNIIQHPGGGQKQISIFANVVMYAGEGRVQYLTDTLPGSSGSPVFDLEWNVVALHRSGGWITEPNAPTKSTYYRNEGVSIDRVIDGLAAAPA
ncbi:trypsin-like peptidase domain-containing protein [Sinorhizobium meliloti]|uniref:trypsin-like peptidase domain-containing protein n=1 Tax=Rhizobium meliloti TaxID=382 RepID=UPI0002F8A7F2|nr:trypsin-like peptidase domain-containing protein [Sinorhizobium meliloti]UDU21348.1 serine protease [Sinorhizobium meliloti]